MKDLSMSDLKKMVQDFKKIHCPKLTAGKKALMKFAIEHKLLSKDATVDAPADKAQTGGTRTEVRSPTSTSTKANTRGNITITGSAGSGDTTLNMNGKKQKN